MIGAAVGYGIQVYNNYQNNGGDLGKALTTNISGEKILGGAVAGATVGLGIGIVAILAGGGAAVAAGAGAAVLGTGTAACEDNCADVASKAVTEVGLDTNAIINLTKSNEEQAVVNAMAGRAPVISPTAAQEFLVGGDSETLSSILQKYGGRIGSIPSTASVQDLQQQAESLGSNTHCRCRNCCIRNSGWRIFIDQRCQINQRFNCNWKIYR